MLTVGSWDTELSLRLPCCLNCSPAHCLLGIWICLIVTYKTYTHWFFHLIHTVFYLYLVLVPKILLEEILSCSCHFKQQTMQLQSCMYIGSVKVITCTVSMVT
ncbi:hypothetical protein BDN67DRAFT_281119 [Paxillus ammoniavirescens]|nr:hypothetical protein BDN67DRAFT_281119 [Paxillus ammoniavirescens]